MYYIGDGKKIILPVKESQEGKKKKTYCYAETLSDNQMITSTSIISLFMRRIYTQLN